MITDKDKATEIANNETLYGEDPDENSKIEECYIAAMEMAKYKNEQIKKAIGDVLNCYQCEANQDLPTSTKALYLNNFAVVRGAMNLLKQKLNLED